MASQQAPPPVGADDSQVPNRHPITKRNNPNANSVQRTRAWTGLWVVVGGDVAIAAAAIFTVFTVWKAGHSNSNITPIVAVLTSAFTAISTMTTAYFGIKTMSNTAQSFAPAVHAAASNAAGQGHADPTGQGGPQQGGPQPRPGAGGQGPGPGGQPPPGPGQPGNAPAGPVPQRPSAPTGPPPTRPSPPTGPVATTGLAGLGLAGPPGPSPSGTFLAAPTFADPDAPPVAAEEPGETLTELTEVEIIATTEESGETEVVDAEIIASTAEEPQAAAESEE